MNHTMSNVHLNRRQTPPCVPIFLGRHTVEVFCPEFVSDTKRGGVGERRRGSGGGGGFGGGKRGVGGSRGDVGLGAASFANKEVFF